MHDDGCGFVCGCCCFVCEHMHVCTNTQIFLRFRVSTHLQHRCGLIVDAYINACMVVLYTMHACIATAWAWLLPAHDAMNGRRFDLLSPLSFSVACDVGDVSHRDLFTEASLGRDIPSGEGPGGVLHATTSCIIGPHSLPSGAKQSFTWSLTQGTTTQQHQDKK